MSSDFTARILARIIQTLSAAGRNATACGRKPPARSDSQFFRGYFAATLGASGLISPFAVQTIVKPLRFWYENLWSPSK